MKYEILDEIIVFEGRVLKQIKALRDFGNVKKGDLGGYVEHNLNLSQEGNCWIDEKTVICESGYVGGDVEIKGNVVVKGNSVIVNDFYQADRKLAKPLIIENDTKPIKGENDYVKAISFEGNTKILGNGKIHFDDKGDVNLNNITFLNTFSVNEINIDTSKEIYLENCNLLNVTLEGKNNLYHSNLNGCYLSDTVMNSSHINYETKIIESDVHYSSVSNSEVVKSKIKDSIILKDKIENKMIAHFKLDKPNDTLYLLYAPINDLSQQDKLHDVIDLNLDEASLDKPKYSLREIKGSELYEIVALKDFGNVRKGDVGGFVSGYQNLSQRGNSWIEKDSVVKGNAKVIENAFISQNSIIEGNAIIGENVIIRNSEVKNNAKVLGNHTIVKNSFIENDAVVNVIGVISDSKIKDHVFLNGGVDISKSEIEGYVKTTSTINLDLKNSTLKDFVKLSGTIRIEDSELKDICLLDGCFKIKNSRLSNEIDLKLVHVEFSDAKIIGNNSVNYFPHQDLDIYTYSTIDNDEAISIRQKSFTSQVTQGQEDLVCLKKSEFDSSYLNLFEFTLLNRKDVGKVYLADLMKDDPKKFFDGKIIEKITLDSTIHNNQDYVEKSRFRINRKI